MSDSNTDNSTVSKWEWVIGILFLLIMGLITFGGLGMMITGYVPEFLQSEAAEKEAGPETPAATQEALSDLYPPLAALPEVNYPPDNKFSDEKVALGRMLFFDTRFSGDGSLSCNSCHPSSDGSWAVSSPISFGYPGSTHWRNASTIINSAYYSKLNWDGSKSSIEKQNKGAWGGAVGGNVDSAMAEERLAQVPEYVRLFNDVFGTEYPLFEDALKAVATYERTIVSQNVSFDAFLGGDENAISDQAKLGYELFLGKAGCIACHNGPLISDDSYHNTGVPQAPEFESSAMNQITFRYEHWAKGVTEEVYNTSTRDLGLYYVTKLDGDKGKFRTASLRDSCYTAPYMHNGVLDTLEDVVAFYITGGGEDENKDPLVQPLNLSEGEQRNLVAFLESLCGDKIIDESPELPTYEAWQMGGN